MISDTRFAAHIRKRAVAVVVKEVRWCWLKESWNAVITPLQGLVGAERVLRLIVKDKARDKEIEFAVVVVIKPGCAGGPPGSRDTGFVCHVSEGAVAVVVVENV